MSWQNKSLLYLKEVCEAYLAANSKTGTVTIGVFKEGLPTTIGVSDLFISNLSGYPQYGDDDTLLRTGHIIATRYKEVSVTEIQSDTSDLIDDLVKYIYDNVRKHSPTIGGVSSQWVTVESTDSEGYNVEGSAFDNIIGINIVFINGVHSPQ